MSWRMRGWSRSAIAPTTTRWSSRPSSSSASLPSLVWHEDEPIAHPSSIALNFVSRLAAERVKVVLTGEGSDETLGGYGRYRYTVWNMALGRMAEGLTGSIGRRLGNAIVDGLPDGSRWQSRLRRTALSRPATLDDLYFDNFAVFDRRAIGALLAPAHRDSLGSHRSIRRGSTRCSRRPMPAPCSTSCCTSTCSPTCTSCS